MGTAINSDIGVKMDINKEESSEKSNDEEIDDLEWSPDQEILLLYSLHGLKPVGPHKYFRMILIRERLSNAMNKKISSNAIWKKLNAWYDMEALDEEEAEADAASSEEIDFELPKEEYGHFMELKLRGLPIKIEMPDTEMESEKIDEMEQQREIKVEYDSSPQDNEPQSNKELEASKALVVSRAGGKEINKRGTKRTVTTKDSTPLKKENVKEIGKRDITKKDEPRKGAGKEEDKKETGKKAGHDLKKDAVREEKKEAVVKLNKRELGDKKQFEQSKKEVEAKRSEQKKPTDTPKNQRETPKQLRTETPKRTETKTTRSETPKPQRTETPKPQRVEALKKESSAEKKKEAEKKVERKSPEKTPESVRGGKLRTRDRKETESDKLEHSPGTKRTKDSTSKAAEGQGDEPPSKKNKTPIVKGRPTRNSVEPQKSVSPAPSPQKRRTRLGKEN